MLIAPDNSPNPPSPLDTSFLEERAPARDVGVNYALIGIFVALLVFTLVVGLGLASGGVPFERAYSLMAIPPFCLALWQIYGFVRPNRSRDVGLLVGAAGWLSLVGALLVQHFAQAALLAQGVAATEAQSAPILATLLGFLAVALIVAGAMLSISHWRASLGAPR